MPRYAYPSRLPEARRASRSHAMPTSLREPVLRFPRRADSSSPYAPAPLAPTARPIRSLAYARHADQPPLARPGLISAARADNAALGPPSLVRPGHPGPRQLPIARQRCARRLPRPPRASHAPAPAAPLRSTLADWPSLVRPRPPFASPATPTSRAISSRPRALRPDYPSPRFPRQARPCRQACPSPTPAALPPPCQAPPTALLAPYLPRSRLLDIPPQFAPIPPSAS